MSTGGKISSTKLTFTLPISCQICLEKVKEPVTCPNQHVFCSLCMEVWLERNKQCPTCRVDITPQSPMRKIIGGSQSQNEDIRSPRTSKQLRRARMELLIRDYENEIAELQRESACLQHSNEELKLRLAEEEHKHMPNAIVPKAKCSRCGNMKDIDSMLEMAKSLQEATRTFEQMKEENIKLKQMNEKLLKELEDLRRSNSSVKQELQMRSPMKFGRLTVATLESRIEAYEKEISQLKKALEKSDLYTESLKDKLSKCSCQSIDSKLGEPVLLEDIELPEPLEKTIPEESLVFLSGHDYTRPNPDFHDQPTQSIKANTSDGVAGIENVLTEDMVNQSLAASFDESSVDQSLFLYSEGTLKSPFTPSSKLSRLTLATPKTGSSGSIANPIHTENFLIEDVSQIASSNFVTARSVNKEDVSKDHDCKIRSFTAQMMPSVESADYVEKLQQIQENLLHPISSSSGSPEPGQMRSFSRRLTFEDTLQGVNIPEISEFTFTEESTRSSCSEEPFSLMPNEDSVQSTEPEQQHDLQCKQDNSQFVQPQSVFQPGDSTSQLMQELVHGSSNPILSSGQFQSEEKRLSNHGREVRHEVSLSVVEAGGSRITTTKLSDSDRDVFSRPSSAPSRTFLLSGSKFSALRPLEPQHNTGELSQFQPVKCKSPSPRTFQPNIQSLSSITPKKEAIRCVVDGRASSPMLRLVSPDEVIGSWKQASFHSRIHSGDSSSQNPGTHKGKETSTRVAILKRNTSGKPSSYASNMEQARSPTVNGVPQGEDVASSLSRKNSRKQCLSDPNTKRIGEHSLEFVSPIKSPKIETKWKWK